MCIEKKVGIKGRELIRLFSNDKVFKEVVSLSSKQFSAFIRRTKDPNPKKLNTLSAEKMIELRQKALIDENMLAKFKYDLVRGHYAVYIWPVNPYEQEWTSWVAPIHRLLRKEQDAINELILHRKRCFPDQGHKGAKFAIFKKTVFETSAKLLQEGA